MQNNSMADIIYDYFTSRILFGYYLLGDRLPSISYICRQFQVSALTVRTALYRMHDEGYIKITERKRSTVIYRPDKQQGQRYRAAFLSRRRAWKTYADTPIFFSVPSFITICKGRLRIPSIKSGRS